MIGSAGDVETGTELHADIVIIGSGAAGITMAKRLAGKSLRVIMLESGPEQFDPFAQSLYKGAIVGQPTDALDVARLRFFGGTTNHWGGWCRPLEPEDFRARKDWPESGWPIARADLDPWYREALEICRLGPFGFDDLAFWQKQPGGEALKPLAFESGEVQSAIFQTRLNHFGETYRKDLDAAQNIRVILEATVLELLPASSSRPEQPRKSVGKVLVTRKDSKIFTVSARKFVVACGGIESARLLLLSSKLHPAGAGNENDLVGRYFTDHAWLRTGGYVRFSKPGFDAPLYLGQTELAGTHMFCAVTGTRAFIEREEIGAFRFALFPTSISTVGLDSMREIAGRLRQGALPDHLSDHLSNIWSDLYVIADSAYKTATGASTSWFAPKNSGAKIGAFLDLNFEPRPNPDSRVLLDTETDAFGQRRVKLDWRLTETDRRTAAKALDTLAHELGRLGVGRTRVQDLSPGKPWPVELNGSDHHSGTARMSDSARTGVVDANCRVHSVDNLYVAGSAVFPTIGYANPTFTIVALASRLADHLERELT